MEFLDLWFWYVLVLLLILSNFLNFFGHHTNGRKSKQISIFGGLTTWIELICGFIFTGWIGGLVLILLNFIVIGHLAQWLAFIAFKRLHPNAKYLTYRLFQLRNRHLEKQQTAHITGIMRESSERQAFLTQIKQENRILTVLNELGEHEGKIDEIYNALITNGSGEFVANCVVTNPSLVREFIELEGRKVAVEDITFYFMESLAG
ncbi:hypothetical protein SAMN05877753_1056 [Bacillus oleivorans]|uniref:Uncharacterized protein n=1 Tax=Bacillus oleivorans TaxID=1448271 RepID=A0A285CUB9_9BACI|nr:hypothetical protein [Bacillus oleivorans]SNX71160.1 hypothetical protein SAMN05877753_1056 [Bacillus oleivorans]